MKKGEKKLGKPNVRELIEEIWEDPETWEKMREKPPHETLVRFSSIFQEAVGRTMAEEFFPLEEPEDDKSAPKKRPQKSSKKRD